MKVARAADYIAATEVVQFYFYIIIDCPFDYEMHFLLV